MILIIGRMKDEDISDYRKAKEHLIDTEKKHQIYHTRNIVTLPELKEMFCDLDDRQFSDLILSILSKINIVYCIKSWEYSNDARLYHDYCAINGHKIIYSKKF